MRKLIILKSIVDLVLILTIPTIPFILFFIPYSFISDSFNIIPFKINGQEVEIIDFGTKIILALMLCSYLILIYCLYLFRKILRSFRSVKIFDILVINNFNKMGYLFIIYAFLTGFPSIIYRLLYHKKITVEFGLNSFFLMLCLGFFFIILSEIFKISKKMKDENELTI